MDSSRRPAVRSTGLMQALDSPRAYVLYCTVLYCTLHANYSGRRSPRRYFTPRWYLKPSTVTHMWRPDRKADALPRPLDLINWDDIHHLLAIPERPGGYTLTETQDKAGRNMVNTQPLGGAVPLGQTINPSRNPRYLKVP